MIPPEDVDTIIQAFMGTQPMQWVMKQMGNVGDGSEADRVSKVGGRFTNRDGAGAPDYAAPRSEIEAKSAAETRARKDRAASTQAAVQQHWSPVRMSNEARDYAMAHNAQAKDDDEIISYDEALDAVKACYSGRSSPAAEFIQQGAGRREVERARERCEAAVERAARQFGADDSATATYAQSEECREEVIAYSQERMVAGDKWDHDFYRRCRQHVLDRHAARRR